MIDNVNKIKSSNIVLMGIKHCGKSTLGKLLSEEKGWQFYDIDYLTEEQYNANHEKSFREIYEKEGKTIFQNLEAISTCKLSAKIRSSGHAVIALGGGTIENHIAMHCISSYALLVYLEEKPELLFERIFRNGLPLFLLDGDPYEEFLRIYEKRSKIYQEYADLIVNINGKNIQEALEELKGQLKESVYGW